MWEIEYTDQLERWFIALSEEDQDAIDRTVEFLMERGPSLGRPLVDHIASSRHQNMKELRVPTRNIRILFAFDPRRHAILLIGGDKTNRWKEWYRLYIPIADDLYDDHLRTLAEEGLL